MKFTKTLVAVAIAGIAAVPMAASATTTLSGIVEVKLTGDDSDTALAGSPGVKEGDAQFAAGDVLFGIAAEQALNSGLTGYGSLRVDLNQLSNGNHFSVDDDDIADSGVNLADSVYVGVKGGFGDVRIGETGNPGEYGQVNDILTDVGDDINEGIGYTGSFGGATVGVAYSPERDQDLLGVGAKFAWNGLSVGVGMQDDGDNANIGASVGFAFAGASIALGYVSQENAFTTAAGGTDDETSIVAKVGYSIAGVSLGLTYDAQTESEDNKVRLDAGYDLGGGMVVSSRVNIFSDGAAGGADDLTDWRIMLAKSF